MASYRNPAGVVFSRTIDSVGLFNHFGQQPKPAGSQPQADKLLVKVRHEVEKIGIGGPITLYLKNGDELHGTVAQFDQDAVQIAEIDRRASFTIKYAEIKKVHSGVGSVNVFTGRRVTRSHGVRIAGLIIATAAIAIPVILLAASKD
jgi:sRNA-binding regulator protein Hfq